MRFWPESMCFIHAWYSSAIYAASHLALDLLQQLAQLALIRLLSRPSDPETLLFVRLWDQVEVYVIHDLMRDPSVIL